MGTTGTEVASRGRLAKETREGPWHPIACGLWPRLFAFNMKRIGRSKLEEIPVRRLGSEIIIFTSEQKEEYLTEFFTL